MSAVVQGLPVEVLILAAIILAVALVFGVVVALRKSGKKEFPAPATPQTSTPAQKTTELPKPVPATLDQSLSKTKVFFQQAFDRVFSGSQGSQFFDDLEEALITADVGVGFSEEVVSGLRAKLGVTVPERSKLRELLKEILISRLSTRPFGETKGPTVVMIVGVNGAGKTTTIAKLCSRFKDNGLKVLVGGADTFRAAATEQLQTWTERVGVDGVFQKQGSDPSAVAFDSVQAAVGRGADVCIVDTAGRLHTKSNLMDELKKMKRVMDKALPGAPHEVWLVLDGTNGQNAVQQAKEFHSSLGLTGIVITKLDGSAKGGAVLAISSEIGVPILFVGVGESTGDLIPFSPPEYVDSLLQGI